MKKQDYLLLNDVKGYERLYLTMVRHGWLRESQYTQVYNWYRANALTCGFVHHMSRQDFCSCLANSQEKPYASLIQTLKALDLLRWNIDIPRLGEAHQSWAPTAYDRLEGMLQQYAAKFEYQYGIHYRSQFTAYKYCEDTLYPHTEITGELDDSIHRKLQPQNADEPELVYICAPLRGDVGVNIEKAKQYTREVFLDGDIPVCPHIYFPQFASVEDAREDRAAMDMGLALLKKCHRINIYADPPTAGMREEIEAAKKWGIQVVQMDGKEKAAPRKEACR
ncbi:hypothetical protein LJC27_05555 [Christensenellaceae bacterium OttesenSCG-928-M15]|nr:hypothetical protein [Christensenellaceae bacterium OttesenSCG-928-M15]